MKNNKGFIGLVIVLAIIGISYYMRTKGGPVAENTTLVKGEQNEVDSTMPNLGITTKKLSIYSDTTCYENNKYFVVSKQLGYEPGSDLLIKYKKNISQNIVCDYKVSPGDFEIKNPTGTTYFFDLKNNILALDSGTAVNNRSIILYDLIKKSKVFEDQRASGDPVLENGVMNYWINSKEIPTIENCPKLYNMGGVIESQVSLNLSTFIKRDLEEKRCTYHE